MNRKKRKDRILQDIKERGKLSKADALWLYADSNHFDAVAEICGSYLSTLREWTLIFQARADQLKTATSWQEHRERGLWEGHAKALRYFETMFIENVVRKIKEHPSGSYQELITERHGEDDFSPLAKDVKDS